MAWISDFAREFKKKRRLAKASAETLDRFLRLAADHGKKHGLPAPLVVSLTSYRKRFTTLPMTLKSILSQSMRPDRVVLFIGTEDMPHLTDEVLALVAAGLEIRETADLRSFTKIIPALRAHPDHYILTFDDDIHYPADTIETLVEAYKRGPSSRIVCHRAHEITLSADGLPRDYRQWQRNTGNNIALPTIFPTGVMGVLYPPGIFHPDVLDDKLFMALCPTADDVWLYWMWRLKGGLAQKIGAPCRVLEWQGTQDSHLREANIENGGNDRAVKAMIDRYGFPRD
jgi:hypothetical protein